MIPRAAGVWLTVHACLPAVTVLAQEPVPSQAPEEGALVHVGYVTEAYYEAPGGAGLLPLALGEARVASQHAELAATQPYSLQTMKAHAVHVLHALDPALVAAGPGLGYGVRRAAQGIAEHIERASAGEDASYNVRTHARHIAGAARSVSARADRVVSLAQRIQSEISISTAAALVTQLHEEAQALFSGRDADRDGLIGWAPPEGGLRQIQQHVTLLERGEAMTRGGVRP